MASACRSGGCTLSNTPCAFVTAVSDSENSTDTYGPNASPRVPTRAASRAVCTDERTLCAVSFALCS